ncbi:MAG: ATP-binding protein, partial [bacterium]|nr:ATP-binding protein [bacterium]
MIKQEKYFNIAGPCQPDEHYMLPAQERCRGLVRLIERNQYFVIHAARQSGKTTLLLELARQLNQAGDYYALYCSLETVQGIIEAEKGIPAIVRNLKKQIRFHKTLRAYPFAEKADYLDFTNVLQEALAYFSDSLDKPLVILFDEVDCLSNGTLISFLRQLRSGYVNRGQIPFPQSVALVGMRNIRDYKGRIREDRETLGSASPFNIVSDALTLRNFNQEEVPRLYAQHTAQTGQQFPSEVTDKVYQYTQGQPWLVNAIAREIVEKMLTFDFAQPIVSDYVEQAVQTIIMRRDTHIDSLLERLKEARVQKIVEPLIIGETRKLDFLDDDYQYVLDLGLLREAEKKLRP